MRLLFCHFSDVNSYRCVADDFGDARKNIRRPFSYVLAWQNGWSTEWSVNGKMTNKIAINDCFMLNNHLIINFYSWINEGHSNFFYPEGYIKDLTSRYDPDWLLVSYRKRVDPDWWKSTLANYTGSQSDNDAEDLSIEGLGKKINICRCIFYDNVCWKIIWNYYHYVWCKAFSLN